MIWLPAFYFIMACGGIVLFMITCDLLTLMGAGCTISGFMVQPLLQMPAVLAVLWAVETLGTTADFSLAGGLVLPLVAYMVAFGLVIVACPPLAQRLSCPIARSHDRALLRTDLFNRSH